MKSYDTETLTGAQVRAGRALIRWSADDLARRARLGIATVRRAEASDGPVNMTAANEAAIRSTLEDHGIVFIPENGGGAGVRLKFNHREIKAIDKLENEGGPAREDDV